MPQALDPLSRRTLVLTCDKAKPDAQQPRFYAKVLTGREWKQAIEIAESLDKKDGKAGLESLYTGLRLGIVEWDNMVDPRTGEQIRFTQDAFEQVLGLADGIELLALMLGGSNLEVDDAKKSESPSPSSTDNSASTASTESARTGRRNSHR